MVPEHRVNLMRGEAREELIIRWQPYIGMDVKDSSDWLAIINKPLMILDRKFFHKSRLVVADEFLQWLESLKDDEVHPIFRATDVTK